MLKEKIEKFKEDINNLIQENSFIKDNSLALNILNDILDLFDKIIHVHSLAIEGFFNDLNHDEEDAIGLNLLKINVYCDFFGKISLYSNIRELIWNNLEKYNHGEKTTEGIQNKIESIKKAIQELKQKYQKSSIKNPILFWGSNLNTLQNLIIPIIQYLNEISINFLNFKKNIDDWISLGDSIFNKIQKINQINSTLNQNINGRNTLDLIKNNLNLLSTSPEIEEYIKIIEEVKKIISNQKPKEKIIEEKISNFSSPYRPKASIQKIEYESTKTFDNELKDKIFQKFNVEGQLLNLQNQINIFFNKL